jgi:hypothetical protein
MNSDIRISLTFSNNLKRRRLQQELGTDGVMGLIDLWIFAGMHRPDGDISGLSVEEIGLAANYPGSAHRFVEVLVRIGFVDEGLGPDGGVKRSIHHWHIHNSWACQAEERSARARHAANKKWSKKCGTHAKGNASSMQDASGTHAKGNAPLLSSPLLTSQEEGEIANLSKADFAAQRKILDEVKIGKPKD